MLRFGRDQSVIEHPGPAGVTVQLLAERWWIGITSPWGGLGFAYDRPVAVTAADVRTGIVDLTGLLRVIAMMVFLFVPFLRKART